MNIYNFIWQQYREFKTTGNSKIKFPKLNEDIIRVSKL